MEISHLEQYADSCNLESLIYEKNIRQAIDGLLKSKGKLSDHQLIKLRDHVEGINTQLVEIDSELTAPKIDINFFCDGKGIIHDCEFNIDRASMGENEDYYSYHGSNK